MVRVQSKLSSLGIRFTFLFLSRSTPQHPTSIVQSRCWYNTILTGSSHSPVTRDVPSPSLGLEIYENPSGFSAGDSTEGSQKKPKKLAVSHISPGPMSRHGQNKPTWPSASLIYTFPPSRYGLKSSAPTTKSIIDGSSPGNGEHWS